MISNHKGSVSIRTILLLTANAVFLIWILSARASAKDARPVSPVSYNGKTQQASSSQSESEPALFIPETDEVIEPTQNGADSQMSETGSQTMPAIPDETLNLAMFDWYESTVRYNWFPSSAQQITEVSEILGEWKGWVKYDPNNEHDTSGDFLIDLLSMVYVGDDNDSEISVLCANNSELYKKLDRELGHLETIHLYDTESDGSKLLDSADLLLTEEQDSVLGEALKRQMPCVLIGTAQQNAWSELVNQGCAIASQDNVELAEVCIKLLGDETLRVKMSGAYWR